MGKGRKRRGGEDGAWIMCLEGMLQHVAWQQLEIIADTFGIFELNSRGRPLPFPRVHCTISSGRDPPRQSPLSSAVCRHEMVETPTMRILIKEGIKYGVDQKSRFQTHHTVDGKDNSRSIQHLSHRCPKLLTCDVSHRG